MILRLKDLLFSSLLSHFEEFAYQNDFKKMLCNSQMETAKERDYINMLRAQQVDGIFLASHTLDIAAAVIKEAAAK